MKRDLKKLFWQAFRFALVGGVNTLLDMGIFWLLTRLVFFEQVPEAAHAISYSCGVVCSLILNKLFTFRQKEPMRPRQVVAFVLVNLAALGVSAGAIWAYQQLWALGPMAAKVLSLPFSLGVNFIGNKLFVFRDK